ncbi:hypothetical protein SRABI27_03750 [Pedobacter sp. Bi27]|uniref:ABC-three component system protein n=1 Tax=Pedobacter sp. Bi27 TaxID=2822351 RepID=UPI001D72C851|nr:ABC-three component system protein [Pedobacter sp. Bi27]CAH0280127.1 hypothetical protein SRABI27_03750 [Pedobacter sp. Bi27]
MASNAPGQLLGFSLQYPRALWHLLKCGPEDKVCLEVFGDVGITKEDHSKISEEDKSSQVGNPVTDRSTDLWKTFFNWTNAVLAGELDAESTTFILYANKKGMKAIVDTFHAAKDFATSSKAVKAAWKKLGKIDAKHEILPYVTFLKTNEDSLAKIIKNFEFVTGSGTGGVEVKKAIKAKHVSDSQVEYLELSLLGWLQKFVMNKLVEKKDAVITWKEFDEYARQVFESARQRELIDFTLIYPLKEHEVDSQKLERPPYILQLEAIGVNDDAIQGAVTAFLKAKTNRFNWIEQELINDVVAQDFEDKLTGFWETQHEMVEITNSALSEENKGKLVYLQCRARKQIIRDQDPPALTVEGTYHFLSNNLAIGWHPKWKATFPKPKDKE